jgi:hypothetical protein
VTLIRDTLRQKLAALSLCSRPYHLHMIVTVEQVGTGRLNVVLRAVVYRNSGEVAADIPTKLSANHAAPEDREEKEAELLRSGAEATAALFGEHFP